MHQTEKETVRRSPDNHDYLGLTNFLYDILNLTKHQLRVNSGRGAIQTGIFCAFSPETCYL